MVLSNHKILIVFTILFFASSIAIAQETDSTKLEQPPFKMFREAEDYTYLKNSKQYKKDYLNAIKYIPLNLNGSINLSFGGQIRPRYEYFSNRFWQAEDDVNFYSQRIALYSNILFGENIRFFGELYHGYTSKVKEIAQYDKVAIFQLFADFTAQLSPTNKVSVRLGRQELALGKARLVGIREGPNIRRSFDMAKLNFNSTKYNIQAFYGKEVIPSFNSFDNKANLFNSHALNPTLWGIYAQFKIKGDIGLNELYYLGFDATIAAFNDVQGNETRHSIGLRRLGNLGNKWRYNTELIYQFGKIDNNTISAFSLATDAYYKFIAVKWQPELGLKLEYSSGDKEAGDGKIQSFNPMFVNPAHYSLAGTATPVNMISIHPSINVNISNKLKLYAEWAIFWRNSSEDALYRPTRFVYLPANGIINKKIGHQFGFMSSYEINRHLSFDLDISYFVAGEYLEKQGLKSNIFHIAPTVSYKF